MAYDDREIERGLIALAHSNGNARAAHRLLESTGMKIPAPTLREWQHRTHKERYETVRATQLQKIREHAAEEHMALATKANGITDSWLDRLQKEGEGIKARELPGAIRNVSTIAGIHTDKARELIGNNQAEDKPRLEFEDVVRGLAAKGLKVSARLDIEPTPEPPKQVPAIDAEATS